MQKDFTDKITVIRVTEEDNALDNKTHQRLLNYVKDRPGTSIHGSIPCTLWSSWQDRNIHALGEEFKRKLEEQRKESRVLLSKFLSIADRILTLGGHVSFEWPRWCAGWALPELQSFIKKWDLQSVNVDGCAAGMVSSDGYPIRKPWRFVTSNSRQAYALQAFNCTHKPGEHVEAAGKETKRTEIYPPALATALLESLFPHSGRIPAMSCEPALLDEHIPKETQAAGFVPSPFMLSEIFEINARKRGQENLEHEDLLECSPYENSTPTGENCLERVTNIAMTKALNTRRNSKIP